MILVLSRTGQVELRGELSQLCLEVRGDDIVPPTSPLRLPILHLVSIMVQVNSGLLHNHWPYLLDLDLPSNPISLTPLCPMSYMDLHSRHHTPQTQSATHLGTYAGVNWSAEDSSCSTHGYSHAEYGVSSSVPYVPSLADRDRGSLKFQSRYMALTGWELTDEPVRHLASGSV
ncbi:hypothetical protein M9H77_17099 [Catharanthus roseus]|uniref:Uncharacterized protein n=1 Tax=Catharanthus roseus TaxID=4058 RepID=A0ACC0B3L1_CATRO|nr:hypothetical protein M9H77_17099 [Catharanthus roseus]